MTEMVLADMMCRAFGRRRERSCISAGDMFREWLRTWMGFPRAGLGDVARLCGSTGESLVKGHGVICLTFDRYKTTRLAYRPCFLPDICA